MIGLLGDTIIDHYIYGDITRLAPEAPIPVFKQGRTIQKGGGAANVQNNLMALGEQVQFFTRIAARKYRYVHQEQILFRVDDDEIPFEPVEIDQLSDITKYFIISDYGKGVVQNPEKLIDKLHLQGLTVIIDPKHPANRYNKADLIKFNEQEYQEYGANKKEVIVTRANKSVLLPGNLEINTPNVNVKDVTGAGDVFLAGLVHKLNQGQDLKSAATFATRLASKSTEYFGTHIVTEEDIKFAENKTVFVNGCFDILHPGHLSFLRKAKLKGMKLIVGLNSDSSIKRLKGSSRPINSEAFRKAMLLNTLYVDEVEIFYEDTPAQLIARLKPDIVVKGIDYDGSDITLKNYSTTNIISKIKNSG